MKLLLFQRKYAAIDKVEQVLLHLLYLYLTGSTVNDESTFDMNCPSPILFSEVDRHNRDEGNPRPLLDKDRVPKLKILTPNWLKNFISILFKW